MIMTIGLLAASSNEDDSSSSVGKKRRAALLFRQFLWSRINPALAHAAAGDSVVAVERMMIDDNDDYDFELEK